MAEDIKNKGQNIGKDKQLPSVSHSYSKREISTEKDKVSLPGRMATALMKNEVSTVNSLEKEYKRPINEIVLEGSIDREGNLIKLDTMGTRVLIAISKHIFQEGGEAVEKYQDLIESESKKNPEERDYERLYNTPKVNINVMAISMNVFGKREGKKTKYIKKTYSEIEKISKVRLPQIIKTGKITIDGEETNAIEQWLEPYMTITGREKQIKIGEEIIPVIIEVNAQKIFYENNWIGEGGRYFLLPDGILDARLPSGRAITTDVFWKGVFMLSGIYKVSRYIRYNHILQDIKKENIIDSEKIKQLKEDALTYANIPFQRVKEAINFDSLINSFRADEKRAKQIRIYERRFKEQLWDALWSLIDRGIITEKSSIDWKKETFTFVFSENKEPIPLNNPGTRNEDEVRPRGFWEKNPFRSR